MAFDWEGIAMDFYNRHIIFFITCGVLYLPVVFGIKYVMRNREPFDLKHLLAFWNFGLALFSLVGMVSMFTHSFRILLTQTPLQNVCDSRIYSHDDATWVFYFNVSKAVEFVDTLFIVMRKKPLIFLHYYHHLVTFFYCWYSNQSQVLLNASGWWFAFMNLAVHSFMYTYYGLTAIGYYPKWNRYLTTCQILQMAIGILILFVSLGCERQNNLAFLFAFIMYFSYLVMFIQLYFDKYNSKEGKERKEKVKFAINGNGVLNGSHTQDSNRSAVTSNGKKDE